MENLYTNRNGLGDFVRNAFATYGERCNVQIASAFFSADGVIGDLVAQRCTVQLIVRLGAGTSPDALVRSVSMPGVQVRYFSDPSFHPKLYIFGGACCLVGSANLTAQGLRTNQEVSILLPSDDPRFDELAHLLVDLWNQAKVLDRAEADRFRYVVNSVAKRTEPDADQAVQDAFGRHAYANIERGEAPANKRDVYLEAYRRQYQEFWDAFTKVHEIYLKLARRLVPEAGLPLRIEIDQFFNFVREEFAPGEAYREAPVLDGAPRQARIKDAIENFWDTDPEYLHTVAEERYPRIREILGTRAGIESASEEELYEGLLVVQAFHNRFRFFDGGQPTMRKRFLADNGVDRIKRMLSYLLHGSEKDCVVRMADCIYDPDYRLRYFGPSCVQETLGWVNDEDVAICNDRTLKSLRWLGFKVNA